MNQSTPTISHFSALVKLSVAPVDKAFVVSLADAIIRKLELTVVNKVHHSFSPIGETLVYILSESHFALHTWPEYNVIHVDLVSCKVLTKDKVHQAITASLQSDIEYSIKIEEHTI